MPVAKQIERLATGREPARKDIVMPVFGSVVVPQLVAVSDDRQTIWPTCGTGTVAAAQLLRDLGGQHDIAAAEGIRTRPRSP